MYLNTANHKKQNYVNKKIKENTIKDTETLPTIVLRDLGCLSSQDKGGAIGK